MSVTLWAVSMLAVRGRDTNHGPCVVEAAGRDEAMGKALRVARRAYPASEGWTGHHVVVGEAASPIDPDFPITRKSTD